MSAGEWIEESDPVKLAEALQATVQTIENSPYEMNRRKSLLTDLSLYLGVPLNDLYQLHGVTMDDGRFGRDQQIAFNVCYSITNTIHNRICSFRPRAQFLPDGGDFKARRAARNMTELSDGWAQREKYQAEASFAFRDRLTGDGGVLKMYIDNDDPEKKTADIKIARFPSWEFYFDAAESIYRVPECGYHVYYLPVEQASRMYEIDEKDLRAQSVSRPSGVVYVTNRDMIRIVDAYSRCGKHVIVVGNTVKLDKPWEYDGIPFLTGTFDNRPVGLWGDGAVKRLRPIQDELIEWQNSVREAHHLTSQQVWLEKEGEDLPTKLNNATVRSAKYHDVAPQVINPSAINPEMYKYFEVLEGAGYKTLGVSQFIASGTKQPGINSAVAIRESSELQTDRLALLSQDWENTRIEAAEWWRRLAVGLVKEGYSLKYRSIRRGTFVELSMDVAERDYEIRAFPSSLFGQTISGRLERAVELIQGGFMTKDEAMRALDMPDLSPIVDLKLAQAYAMEFLCDEILEDGHYETPDDEIDPAAFYDYAKKRYLLTISDGSNYPLTHKAQMRKLLAYLKPKAQAAQVAATAASMPAGGAAGLGAGPEQIQSEQQTPAAASPAV